MYTRRPFTQKFAAALLRFWQLAASAIISHYHYIYTLRLSNMDRAKMA